MAACGRPCAPRDRPCACVQSSKAELDVLVAHQEAAHGIQREIDDKQAQLQVLVDRSGAVKQELEEAEQREAGLAARVAAVDSKRCVVLCGPAVRYSPDVCVSVWEAQERAGAASRCSASCC